MPYDFIETNISGLMLIIPHFFRDERGCFIKDFERQIFEENGLPACFYESNESKSRLGTLRGLHFQIKYPQGKLIRVVKGTIYDVAVDLRPDSPTFGKWQGFYLSEQEPQMLYIPENFAHGVLALEEDTIFTYKCTDRYCPEAEQGIRWDDADLAITWPLDRAGGKLILSEKDAKLPSLADYMQR